MAKPKTAARSKKSAGEPPRGAALIASVIEAIRRGAEGLPSNRMLDAPRGNPAPVPMPSERLEKLTLADGAPLPPSLAAWFAFDGAWQPFEVDERKGRLKASTFQSLLERALPDIAEAYAPLGEALLPGDCYRVFVPQTCSDNTVLFLYSPAADAQGELPVVGFDFTDDGIVGVFAAGFDVYMARVVGIAAEIDYAFGDGPPPYDKAGRAALKRVLSKAPQGDELEIHQGVISVGSLADMSEFD